MVRGGRRQEQYPNKGTSPVKRGMTEPFAKQCSIDESKSWKLCAEDGHGPPAGVATTVSVIFPANYIENKEQSVH